MPRRQRHSRVEPSWKTKLAKQTSSTYLADLTSRGIPEAAYIVANVVAQPRDLCLQARGKT
jgi:hypothetical protein